jgi:hypothetical protein
MPDQSMALSPALAQRIDALDGCRGSWFLIEDGEPQNRWAQDVSHSPKDALAICLDRRWRGVSLGFQPDLCGYSDYADPGLIGKANFKHFQDRYSDPEILTASYGWNGESIVVDLRFASEDLIESIVSLEDYPLADEELYSELEMQEHESAWEDTYSKEWFKILVNRLDPYAADNAEMYWAEELVEATVSAEVALELFERCREAANEYWVVEDLSSGAYINMDRIAAQLTGEDLVSLGLLTVDRLAVPV